MKIHDINLFVGLNDTKLLFIIFCEIVCNFLYRFTKNELFMNF